MRESKRVTIGLAVLAICLGTAMLGAGVAPAAGKKSCNISGKETKLGASYVTSVSAKGVGCRKALRVVKAFHKCRKANGGADGRCRGKVLRFKCSETRDGTTTQYNASVKCKKGTKRVWQTYTQNV